VPLEVKPGTQSGADVVVSGYGVPSLRGSGRGDIVVRVVVETPTRLDERQQELMRELAALRGEEQPSGDVAAPHGKSVFDRLRGAFGQR
jgi:molecular chaperone DnaJ